VDIKDEKFLIKGGKPLEGEVTVSGAKNSATKLIVSSLLSKGKTVLTNSPNKINDVQVTADICRSIGSEIQITDDRLEIVTPEIKSTEIPQDLGGTTRTAILLAGPLLHRMGEARIPIPGGCRIGSRPVNYHIDALRKLGCEVDMDDFYYTLRADKLKGANIRLEYPSVGATENILIAATLAKGRTNISNAAIEPEIIDLIKYLQKMGAIIEISTDRKITIEGVASLEGACHRVIPDRNESASFACAAIASKGNVLVKDAIQDDLITFLNTIRKVGGGYKVKEDGIQFFYKDELKPIALETNVHPGFMTDWQQPFVVLLTQAKGVSIIHETVYEKRFGYVSELIKMGAEIELFSQCLGGLTCRFANTDYNHSAVVKGKTDLHGAEIYVPDLRAGISYLIAGAIAGGESLIHGVYYLDRGYENIDVKLRNLGAEIKRL
jgi:UDP-N-acetylglucosamine 1-carboxyvinyltransferase